MATRTVTDEDGDEHDLFECDCCGRVPVFDLLYEHEEHNKVKDIFRDDSGRHKSYYLQPDRVYHIIEFDGSREPRWEICGKCRSWLEYCLNGGLLRALQDGSVRGYDE